jgi:hypothetical protein
MARTKPKRAKLDKFYPPQGKPHNCHSIIRMSTARMTAKVCNDEAAN